MGDWGWIRIREGGGRGGRAREAAAACVVRALVGGFGRDVLGFRPVGAQGKSFACSIELRFFNRLFLEEF